MDACCPICPSAARGSSFDPRTVRRDFPVLQQTVRGKPLTYLDNAATMQKPSEVIQAVCQYYGTCNANVHRAFHFLAEEATRRFEEVRKAAAAWIGAGSSREIVFTRGTTEGINLVAHAWARKFLKPGDAILLTEMEHHSNLVPWQLAARATGATLRFVPVHPDGTLDLDAFHAHLASGGVRLAAVTQMSNVLGTVNPVRDLAAAAHRAGALFLVDGAQSVAHLPVSVRDIGCDFLAFSGHKMCGPTGIGVLYARADLLEAMDPFLGGGEMIDRVGLEESTWAEIPHKFEAGTPNISSAIGLGAAFDYLNRLGRDTLADYERGLTRRAVDALRALPCVRVFGDAPERGGAVSFGVDGVHPHDLAQFLDGEGIAIRAGHLCCQPLMRRLGVPAVNRASLAFYNLEEEVDRLADAIGRARAYFGHGP
jgi:cysteine desulfurase/selenocysteine lyase